MMVELNDFLVWMMAGGCVVAFSWVMEQVSWFQTLTPSGRQWLQFAGSVVFGLAAWAVTTYVPKEVLDQVAPVFRIIGATFGMIFLNQVAHANNPKRLF